MGLENDSFPSSKTFEAIQEALKDDAVRASAIKDTDAVIAITLKNGGKTESWHIDLKEAGQVGNGLGNKPDVTITVNDTDFAALASGSANSTRLFMAGKLKVKGKMAKATKLEALLSKINNPKAKL